MTECFNLYIFKDYNFDSPPAVQRYVEREQEVCSGYNVKQIYINT